MSFTFRKKVRRTFHGQYGTPTYYVWAAMLQRCLNPRNPTYGRYGGRGITVCKRWLIFQNFLTDMGTRPDGLTLDRIDNNAGYKPSNCQWATLEHQVRNTRRNRFFEHEGRRQTIGDWADELGLNRSTVYKRINRSGWEIREALGL